MALPAWVFQPENFELPPPEDLICSICQMVFCEPIECPCKHVFCNNCIKTWIQAHRSCPICRKRTLAVKLHPVNRIITNLINGLKLSCKNSSVGCVSKFKIEACEEHMKVCSFEKEDCPNECGTSVYRKDIDKHKQEDCPYRDCKMCSKRKVLRSSVAFDRLRSENTELKEKVKKLEEELNQVKRAKKETTSVGVSFSSDTFASDSEDDEIADDVSEDHEIDEDDSDSDSNSDVVNIGMETSYSQHDSSTSSDSERGWDF